MQRPLWLKSTNKSLSIYRLKYEYQCCTFINTECPNYPQICIMYLYNFKLLNSAKKKQIYLKEVSWEAVSQLFKSVFLFMSVRIIKWRLFARLSYRYQFIDAMCTYDAYVYLTLLITFPSRASALICLLYQLFYFLYLYFKVLKLKLKYIINNST